MGNRLIDFDRKAGVLWISFKYDASVINTVKSIRGRSFDQETKRWSVPIDQIDEAIQKLEPLHFSFTPRLRDYWRDHRDGDPLSAQEPEPEEEGGAYSVSKLNEEARSVLGGHFTETILLEAEISGWDRNRAMGHAYFELVERVAKGADPIARIPAVCFGRTRQKIASKLNRVGHQLKDGQRVRLFVRPEIYPQGGKFQVVIQDVDTEFSVDQALKRRDVVLARLRETGLTEQNLKRSMPICPLRVGLVTAPDTDGYADFVHELEESPFSFEISFAPARMQGQDASSSIVRAVEFLSAQPVDVIVVVRGGGAKLSLADLDTIEIATAVCTSPVKVVCGIGHHRDKGVLDHIARSEKTPTAAAQFLVRRVDTFLTSIKDFGRQINASAKQKINTCKTAVDAVMHATARRTHQVLAREHIQNDRATQRLAAVSTRDHARSLEKFSNRVVRAATHALQTGEREIVEKQHRTQRIRFTDRMNEHRRTLDIHRETLARRTTRKIVAEFASVDRATELVAAHSPDRVKERGYAILRDVDGRIVTSVEGLKPGDRVRAHLKDGDVPFVVDSDG